MAIYTTNNTPYKGRSLQDMLVPYLMYTQRYDDIANKMSELGDQSVIWNNLLSPTRDHETWTMVNNYNERLGNTIADMQNGNIDLNTAMNRLQNMRREYNSWGTAVDNAYKQKQKFIEEQRALALQPGGYHVTRPAESISIDELMANPAASYEALSEKELYDRGKNAAEAASGRRYSVYETTRFKNEYNVLVNQKGYSQKDAAKFLADKYNIPELGKIFDNISTEYNLDRFGNTSSIDRIQLDQSIFNGILDGMTGGRTETNFGKIERPKPPTLPSSGNETQGQHLRLPLSPLVQGAIQGNDVNNNRAVLDENGNVIDVDVVQNKVRLDEIRNQLSEYKEAVQNGTFSRSDFQSDPSGNRKVTTNASEHLNPDGTLKGSSGGASAYTWTYNDKTYSIDEYNRLIKEYSDLNKPNQSIQDVIDRYGYLQYLPQSENPIDAANVVNLGRGLDRSVAQKYMTDFPYKLSQSDNNDIINNYNTYLGDTDYWTDSYIGVYQVDKNGNPEKIKGAADVDFGKNGRLIFKDNVLQPDGSRGIEVGFRGANGQDYIWRGDEQIEKFKDKYNGVKNYLEDFTRTGVGVGKQEMVQYDSRLGEEDLYRSLGGAKGANIPGTSYYGFVLYDKYTGDITKLILDMPYYKQSYYYIDPATNQYVLNPGSQIIGSNSISDQYNNNERPIREVLDAFIQDEGEYLSTYNQITKIK